MQTLVIYPWRSLSPWWRSKGGSQLVGNRGFSQVFVSVMWSLVWTTLSLILLIIYESHVRIFLDVLLMN